MAYEPGLLLLQSMRQQSGKAEPPQPDPHGFDAEQKSFGEKTITLATRPDQENHVVHEALLCEHSPLFQSYCKDEWKQPVDGVIRLPDDNPDVVRLFVQWVYSGRILCRNPNHLGKTELNLLIEAFIFGEKVQNCHFQDASIDAIIKFALDGTNRQSLPDVVLVNRVYEGTPLGSPLHRLLVDLWVRYGQPTWNREGLKPEFLMDLAGKLLAVGGSSTGAHPLDGSTRTCSYHQHAKAQRLLWPSYYQLSSTDILVHTAS